MQPFMPYKKSVPTQDQFPEINLTSCMRSPYHHKTFFPDMHVIPIQPCRSHAYHPQHRSKTSTQPGSAPTPFIHMSSKRDRLESPKRTMNLVVVSAQTARVSLIWLCCGGRQSVGSRGCGRVRGSAAASWRFEYWWKRCHMVEACGV